MPGPDFPTAGIILGRSGIRQAYETGRGSILMRGRVDIEEMRGDREAIIITEIPYQVNKAAMIEKIAELVREKRIEGISDIRDESDRHGMRVVIELKRDAVPDVVLNQLYRFTPLQSSFGCNFVALNGGKPELMNLPAMLTAFIEFREEVVTRRARFLLNKARDRAHVLVGLAVAVANIDEVIALIRTAPDPATARERLMARDWPAQDVAPLIALIDDPRHTINDDGTFKLSDEQARAILALTLSRLTALGRDEIGDELNGLGDEIADYLDILRSRERVRDDHPRRADRGQGPVRDAAPDRDRRGGRRLRGRGPDRPRGHGRHRHPWRLHQARAALRLPGAAAAAARAARAWRRGTRISSPGCSSPTPTRRCCSSPRSGQVYKLKVWRLPLAEPQGSGKALINLLPLEPGERITSIMPLPEDEADWEKLDIMFATTARQRAPQHARRLRRGQPERQDRHEARRGRRHRRRRDLLGDRRRAADHRAAARPSASRSTTCASSRAATRPACAASRWPRATRSSRWRSSATSTPRRPSAPPTSR